MKKYIAEFIGTFALVFCGTGSVIIDQQSNGSLGLVGISAAFGIIVTAMIYTFGSISGTHINPAVTISLAIGKLMPKSDILGYLASQVLGAFLASGLLTLMFPDNLSLGGTLPSGSILQSFSIELILTFFLMLTILGVTSQKETSPLAGIIIGITVTGIILFAGPISGGSFNPARSLAPAIVSGNLTTLWIYLSAPILGAIIATFTWKLIRN
ncbi:MIP/aquaporin family protein [Thalassobellus citreus]|uniref:MIP/aquaporin family protein n=1 Tax=Thalassobellus citreus TaxID=3367752 RepID=UPI003791C97C